MKIGLVGLPGSGKSTVFRMLTGRSEAGLHGSELAVVQVPDPRTERLAEISGSAKVVQPDVTFVDLMALHKGDSEAGEELELVKLAGDAEAFALVLQCFGDLDYRGEELDPEGDLETVLLEMTLTDLGLVEKRGARIGARGGKLEAHEKWEKELLGRVHEQLEAGGVVREMELGEDEVKLLRGFSLLTMKPVMVVLNVAEAKGAEEKVAGVRSKCEEWGIPHVEVAAELEEEIAELPAEMQAEVAEDYGMKDLGRDRLIRAAYGLLDTITFFTTGERESHGWTVSAGAKAPEAAGKIHTDMQQGFIRAEVIPFEALDEHGSEKVCREHGLMRLEGREYEVQDGDVMHIRFSR